MLSTSWLHILIYLTDMRMVLILSSYSQQELLARTSRNTLKCRHCKCLANIHTLLTLWSHLSWGLKPPGKAMVLAELVHFDAIVGQLSALVTLVSQQHGGDALSVSQHQFGVQVLFPLDDGLEGCGPCHVEHYKGSHGFTVVHSCHVTKTFLTCDEQTHKHTHRALFIGVAAFTDNAWQILIVSYIVAAKQLVMQLALRLQLAVPVFPWNSTFLCSYCHVAPNQTVNASACSCSKHIYLN